MIIVNTIGSCVPTSVVLLLWQTLNIEESFDVQILFKKENKKQEKEFISLGLIAVLSMVPNTFFFSFQFWKWAWFYANNVNSIRLNFNASSSCRYNLSKLNILCYVNRNDVRRYPVTS